MRHSSVPPEATLRVEVHGLRLDGELVDDATVTVEAIYHRRTLDEVPGVGVPISLLPVVGVLGSYRGTITDDNGLELGRWYTARILAVAADGSRRPFREDILVTTEDDV